MVDIQTGVEVADEAGAGATVVSLLLDISLY